MIIKILHLVFVAALFALPVAESVAQKNAKSPTNRARARSSDSYILSATWETLAFWEGEKLRKRMHYLEGTVPPLLPLGKFSEDWDRAANIAALDMQSLPAHSSGSPSFASFLDLLKQAEENAAVEEVSEESDSQTAHGSTNDEPLVVEQPVTPVQDEAFAEPQTEEDPRDQLSEDIESVFPRPHERYVSGERLLMFFPVDSSSSESIQSPGIMLPVDASLIFNPPSANMPRSTVSIQRDQ